MDIADLIARCEGKTLEFKRDLSSPKPVVRTLVAFANTAGGKLVLGIDDDGSIRGVDDPLALEERVANLVSDSIGPRLVPDIDIVSWRDVAVLVVTVYPGGSRPYHVIAEGSDSGCYVRVGSTNRRADAALRLEIGRTAAVGTFDEQALAELDSEAIDFRAASESFAGIRRVGRRELLSLRVLAKDGERVVPTVGGVLLFGIDRASTFPDAWLQAGRFKGATRTTITDTSDIDLPLPDTVDAALAFVKRNIALRPSIEGARRTESWEYPLVAVREALVNALVHADYSQAGAPIRLSIFDDRLEIENPGLLMPGLTFEDVLGGVSRLRNRVIGRVFRELGLIEQWGSGMGRMIESCREAGLRDPRFEEVGTRFRVTLYSAQVAAPRTDGIDATIVKALADNSQGLTTSQVAETIELTTRATRTRLKSLVESGIVVEVGTGPHDPLRRYLIAEERAGYGGTAPIRGA